MATQKETIEFILEHLEPQSAFRARAMFGEYALYANEKVVALICDDMLYVKIMDASKELEKICEKAPPYPSAKLHYLVEESQTHQIKNLSKILLEISNALPTKNTKPKRPKKGKNI